MITKSLSIDLKSDGIIAVAVHPGHVITEFSGPKAHITTETSVTGLLRTMSVLNEHSSGCFLNYDGAAMPW